MFEESHQTQEFATIKAVIGDFHFVKGQELLNHGVVFIRPLSCNFTQCTGNVFLSYCKVYL